MNPNRGGEVNLEKPVAPAELGAESDVPAGEQGATHQESSPSKQGPAPSIALPQDLPAAKPVVIPGNVTDDQMVHPIGQTTGQKGDHIIEKQWVERAKAVVAATRDDPYKQKSEMSKVKADYIQKRFAKTIKADTSGVT